MKFPWFTRSGVFYVPKAITGWIILLGGVAFLVYAFMDIDSRSHSNSDTLMNFFFMMLIVGAIYSLIAFLTSRKVN